MDLYQGFSTDDQDFGWHVIMTDDISQYPKLYKPQRLGKVYFAAEDPKYIWLFGGIPKSECFCDHEPVRGYIIIETHPAQDAYMQVAAILSNIIRVEHDGKMCELIVTGIRYTGNQLSTKVGN
jgi:hypothetical protein